MTYRAAQAVPVWKGHECYRCGCRFRYRITLKGVGVAEKPADAVAEAEKSLTLAARTKCRFVACPTCGAAQPEMIAVWRFRLQLVALTLLCASTLYLGIRLDDPMPIRPSFSVLAVSLGVLCVVVSFIVSRIKPILRSWSDPTVITDRVGDPQRGWAVPAVVEWWPKSQLLVMVLASLTLLTPEAFRLMTARDSSFSGCSPSIAGSTLSVPCRRRSEHEGALGGSRYAVSDGRQLKASCRRDTWADVISVGSKSSVERDSTLWADVVLPDDSMVGQQLDLYVTVDARYPRRSGQLRYEDATASSVGHVSGRLVSRDVAGLYLALWYVSLVLGAAGFLAASLWLWATLKSMIPHDAYFVADEGR
jgi:hypothetical protein